MMSTHQENGAADAAGKERQKTETCWQRVKAFISLVPKDATPPNWGVLWLIFISLFASAFTLTFLFPFLPQMILTFGYKEEEKGMYVGLVASSVFAGRAVGSFFWGWLSDLKGRRLVLLITIFLNGIFSFLFGFVGSLELAMIVRFLAGLGNGTVGVAKTVLYDISDNTNQAFSMSVISIASGSGLILGPTVGGYLAEPVTKYPGAFPAEGFFTDFPFILPSVCCLVVCGIIFIVVFFKFQEPRIMRNTTITIPDNTEDSPQEGKGDVSSLPASQALLDPNHLQPTSSLQHLPAKIHMSHETLHCESEMMYYLAQVQSSSSHQSQTSSEKAVFQSMHNLNPATVSLWSEDEDILPRARKRSYSHGDRTGSDGNSKEIAPSELLRHKGAAGIPEVTVEEAEIAGLIGDPAGGVEKENSAVLRKDVNGVLKDDADDHSNPRQRSKLSSCCHSIKNSGFVQLLRIRDVQFSVALYTVLSFAVIGYEDVFTIFASTTTDYSGLGFSTDEIGLALGAVAIPVLFLEIKIYPMLVARFGIKRSSQAYLVNIFFIFIPVQLIPLTHLLADNKVWVWMCLVALTLPMHIAANSCFTGSSLVINNSVASHMVGKANGIGMACTAIARTLAPTLGGAMFSWSLRTSQTVGPPFDVSLTFNFFGFILFISALQAVFLPDHLDHQKK